MATSLPRNRQPVSFPEAPAPPALQPEVTYEPSYFLTEPGDESEARTRQLSLFVEFNAALAGALDVEPVLGAVLVRLADRERLSRARIYRLDEMAGMLRPAAYTDAKRGSPRAVSLQEYTLAVWVTRHRSAVYIPQVEFDPRCRTFEPLDQCAYAVPLQTSKRVWGVLEVAADRPDGISATTRKLIDQLAGQAALCLERGEIYHQLRTSEERLRSIFEQVHFGVALATLDGRLLTVNPAFAHLLGNPCEELPGRHFTDLAHPQDAPAMPERLRALLNDGSVPANLEVRYRRKTGDYVWCATNISVLHDATGRPEFLLAMVQNIDERKRAEEERDRLQQQLFQAQKMEALGTLAGGIAHDFNNLLSVMLGFASLARQRLDADDPLQDSMGMIEESAHRAAELTRQLLGFARPERQQVRPVNVDEVLDRVRRMVERTFDRNIAVAVLPGSEPLWVNAEPSYLEQALLNMCINARDAMPQGGTLTLQAGAMTVESPPAQLSAPRAPGRYASISVQDTGSGIAPDILSRVFEPFFTTKEPGRGTGLGLAMVYGFVKNHDGFVKAESDLGQGARFTIFLPLIPAPSLEPRPNSLAKMELGSGTILVIDDEPLVRAFATAGLKGLGYKVLVAENGKEALQIYEQHRGTIDCVLLDLIMPELSGLETYRRMRKIDPQTRVVFASGYSTGEILRDAPDARAAAFLGKPYTLEGLSAALRTAGVGRVR